MKKLAILGASGHGKVLADTAEILGWQEVIFFDDAWPELLTNSHWKLDGNTEVLLKKVSEFDGVIVAIGNNSIRLDKASLLQKAGAKLISLIHPSAQVSSYSSIEVGSFVGANAVINVDTKIGLASIINTGAVVEHDCQLGSAVHISPNAALAGGVVIGACSWVGIGSAVKQLVSIGSNSIIGAGSVVIKDVLDDVTIVGNPAKPLIKN